MLKKTPQGKKNSGSALVVTLLILSIILISALSITLVSVRERKASIGSSASNEVYQLAETGVEEIMQAITRGNHDCITSGNSDCVNDLMSSLPSLDFSCNQASGFIEKEDLYTVELINSEGDTIHCNDDNALISGVAKIKSIGAVSNAKRALIGVVSNKITKLLMHFENNFEDDSFFKDSYDIERESTDPVFDSLEKEIGNYSAKFDGTKNIKILDTGENFNFTNKDFTIEAWVKDVLTFSNKTVISQWFNNEKQFRLYYKPVFLSPRELTFEYSLNGNSLGGTIKTPMGLLDYNWHHIVVERKGGKIYLFVDGEKKAEEIISNPIYSRSGQSVYIGVSHNNSAKVNYFNGNIDELRITKGVARYDPAAVVFDTWKIPYEWNN